MFLWIISKGFTMIEACTFGNLFALLHYATTHSQPSHKPSNQELLDSKKRWKMY